MTKPPASPPLYCAKHPATETYLRCNRCGAPICARCARSTPTGYRCPDCVRAQQKVFETVLPRDYLIGFVLAALLSGMGNLISALLGFWGVLLAFVVAYITAEAVRKATGRRRGEKFYRTVAAGAAVGTLPFTLMAIITLIGSLAILPQDGGSALGLLLIPFFQGAYVFIIVFGVYRRLKGIVL